MGIELTTKEISDTNEVVPFSPDDPVESMNFKFLENCFPELAELGGFAEKYAHSDPGSALAKLRSFAEAMVIRMYQKYDYGAPPGDNLFTLLDHQHFQDSTPPQVLTLLHSLRKEGNHAVHSTDQNFDVPVALDAVEDAYRLGKWYYLAVEKGTVEEIEEFQPISEPPGTQFPSRRPEQSIGNIRY